MSVTSAPASSAGPSEIRREGAGVSPGIAIAQALVYSVPEFSAQAETLDPGAAPEEISRFERAIGRAERELRKISTVAREKLGEASAEIFEAQIMLLHDPTIGQRVRSLIEEEHRTAEFAIQHALRATRRRMEASANEYLRDRAGDIVDVQNRIIRNLRQARAVSTIEPDRIVVAETLTAADLLLFSRRNVLGVATDFGGPTSHVSIMARSLGVPAVVSLHGLARELSGGETVILDGLAGRVIVNPTEETLATYQERRERYRDRLLARRHERHLPAETRDGVHITLRSNVELEAELDTMEDAGSEGIGLFRTEMLLLASGRALEEDEQVAIYRRVVQAAAPHSTTFRLLDLGGDKLLPMAHREHNPFLGWRGVRILLDRPEILTPQLRAIMRVAHEGPVRVLIPMISGLDELHRIRFLWDETAAALAAESTPHRSDVPLGIMVEVPSVALAADRYAVEVDFFSIGTNDLTQFVLAVDRGNDLVSSRYRELHPVVLQLMQSVVDAGKRHNIPVALCGEMAGDPRIAPLLVGLGLRELSASPTFLPDVKVAIRSVTVPEAEDLAREALAQPDAQSVLTLTGQWMREHLPELTPYLDGGLNGDSL